MPQLGLGLRANISASSLIDGDAASYFVTAGITDPTAKAQINSFVKGVKSIGLWNNMVSWPLRSSQNKGSGTTAYSLGGYGAFNGAIEGGPSWSSSGIVFSNTSQRIFLTYPLPSPLYSVVSSFAVFLCGSTGLNNFHLNMQTGYADGSYLIHKFDGQSAFGSAGVYGNTTRNSINGYPNQDSGRSINLTTFQSSGFSANTNSDTTYQDGSVAFNGAKTSLPTRNPTGTAYCEISSNSSSKTHAFQAAFTSVLTNSDHSNLHSLYKTTLGVGLGLP